MQFSFHHRRRPLIAALVLCAIMLRAAIPQGFMPGSIADGTPLVICSGGVYKTVLLDEQGNKIADEKSHHAQSICLSADAPLTS